MRGILFGSWIAMCLAACAAERSSMEPARVAGAPAAQRTAAAESAAAAEGGAPPLRAPARKLIRTVELELRVADTGAAARRAQAMAAAAGGYVAAVNAYRQGGVLFYQITLKVPGESLESVVERLKALAEGADGVERESLSTEDVTDRYIDLEARLRTLRATEAELQALLAESRARGHKAEDIMAIYHQLTEIRTRAEQHQGQLNALENLTTYSTVQLRLRPAESARPIAAEGWRPGETARRSTRALLGALRALADFAIVVLIVVLPIAALVALPLWLLARLLRRARRRGSEPPSAAAGD